MPLDDAALAFASQLAASLCHDLAGPVEALASVADLLDKPRLGPEAIEVTREATETLSRRLRLFRAAWAGLAGPVTVGELERFAAGLQRIERLRLDLRALDSRLQYEPLHGQVILNLLMIAASALPRGGVIGLSHGGDRAMLLRIEGAGAAWPKGLAAEIADKAAGSADGLAPHIAFTRTLARRAGLRLSMLLGASEPPPLLLDGIA